MYLHNKETGKQVQGKSSYFVILSPERYYIYYISQIKFIFLCTKKIDMDVET